MLTKLQVQSSKPPIIFGILQHYKTQSPLPIAARPPTLEQSSFKVLIPKSQAIETSLSFNQ